MSGFCNRYGATDYRAGLIRRIGPARVEALEANNTPTKWTREGLRALRAHYKAATRAIKEQA